MTPSMTPPSDLARAEQGAGERPLEDLIERVPVELLLAEDSAASALSSTTRTRLPPREGAGGGSSAVCCTTSLMHGNRTLTSVP